MALAARSDGLRPPADWLEMPGVADGVRFIAASVRSNEQGGMGFDLIRSVTDRHRSDGAESCGPLGLRKPADGARARYGSATDRQGISTCL